MMAARNDLNEFSVCYCAVKTIKVCMNTVHRSCALLVVRNGDGMGTTPAFNTLKKGRETCKVFRLGDEKMESRAHTTNNYSFDLLISNEMLSLVSPN
jgi:hypothetical protein